MYCVYFTMLAKNDEVKCVDCTVKYQQQHVDSALMYLKGDLRDVLFFSFKF